MLQYFKHNLKKKNFYFSLVLYFYFFTYKLLFFFQIDVIKLDNYLKFFSNILKVCDAKLIKVNTSNILSIFNFNKTYNNKTIFTIFKRDLFIVSTNNLISLNKLNDPFLLNNLVMFCIDYYFLNIKYLCKIDIFYNLFLNNYNLFKVFLLKLFYINKSYSFYITSNINKKN